jgi:hypothetical protein
MAVSTAVRRIGAGLVAVAVIAAGVTATLWIRRRNPPPPRCRVTTTSETYTLDLDQASGSTTIAAVGKRLGMPDHAVTIALATALQESRLHNLPYGDRDSLGLFQQRPSQGWGTKTEILTPSYAAAAFFRALTRVDGWETLPITVAAQRVQRSGTPTAYAQWEPEARALAIALTGEAEAGFTCRFSLARSQNPAPAVASGLANELGVASLDAPFASQRGWTVATWLVGHAQQYRVTNVSFRGREWRASTGTWRMTTPNEDRVRFRQQAAET